MEFYPRQDLSKPPFNLELSDAELLDLVKAWRLKPFIKKTNFNLTYPEYPPDPISEDHDYIPAFPWPIQVKYKRLQEVHNFIKRDAGYLEKLGPNEWEGYFDATRARLDGTAPESSLILWGRPREQVERELSAFRTEHADLEREFKDIAGLFKDLDLTGKQWQYFIELINGAFYRRDHIEAVRDGYRLTPETLAREVKGEADIESVSKPESPSKNVLKLTPGTNWNQISITLLSDEMVRIVTPKGEGRFTYHELGFKNQTKGNQPVAIWNTLKLFCKLGGEISSSKIESYDPKLVKNISLLNKRLQRLFSIKSNFHPHFKKARGYKSEINFSDETSEQMIRPIGHSRKPKFHSEY